MRLTLNGDHILAPRLALLIQLNRMGLILQVDLPPEEQVTQTRVLLLKVSNLYLKGTIHP